MRHLMSHKYVVSVGFTRTYRKPDTPIATVKQFEIMGDILVALVVHKAVRSVN